MSVQVRLGSLLLVVTVLAGAAGLVAWKQHEIDTTAAAALNLPEPSELVAAAIVQPRQFQPTTSVIGTVLALRSVSLRNELPGTVHRVALEPGRIVEPGTVLVALDVAVESAELAAREAEAVLAESVLARVLALRQNKAVSEQDVDRARADRDVARAQVARVRAIIERKTIRAPFRARVGLADVHPGQYLNEGTLLTTLQGVDTAVHVDFNVEEQAAASLRVGDEITIVVANGSEFRTTGHIVALDARVDPTTRNTLIRARVADAAHAPPPGASVRVVVPTGAVSNAVSVPASALRKGPSGDHVFILKSDANGDVRASQRHVQVAALAGDEAVIAAGLEVGERVATTGSFKLREAVRVAFAADASPDIGKEL